MPEVQPCPRAAHRPECSGRDHIDLFSDFPFTFLPNQLDDFLGRDDDYIAISDLLIDFLVALGDAQAITRWKGFKCLFIFFASKYSY